MNLYAFDCDGTLEHGGGPIGLRTLKRLEKQGHIVVIVSDSLSCKCLWNTVFPYISGAEEGLSRTKSRKRALLRTKKEYEDCDRYIYVSDDPGDHKIADKTGYEYIHPDDFARQNPRRNIEKKEKEIIQSYIKRWTEYISYEDVFESSTEHGFYGFIDKYGKLLWRKREHGDFIRGLLRKILDKEHVDYADLPELYEVFFRKTKLIRADFIPGEEFDISIWGKININQIKTIVKFADACNKFYFDIFLQSENVSVGGEGFYKFIDKMRKYDLIPRTFVLRNPRRNNSNKRKILAIARRVKTLLRKTDKFVDCIVISETLTYYLRKAGFNAKTIEGCFITDYLPIKYKKIAQSYRKRFKRKPCYLYKNDHWWVEVDGDIIDLDAKQFDLLMKVKAKSIEYPANPEHYGTLKRYTKLDGNYNYVIKENPRRNKMRHRRNVKFEVKRDEKGTWGIWDYEIDGWYTNRIPTREQAEIEKKKIIAETVVWEGVRDRFDAFTEELVDEFGVSMSEILQIIKEVMP